MALESSLPFAKMARTVEASWSKGYSDFYWEKTEKNMEVRNNPSSIVAQGFEVGLMQT